MSQSIVRCNQCGATHEAHVRLCPVTGRPIERRGALEPPLGPAPAKGPPALTPPPPPTMPAAPEPERSSVPSMGGAPSARRKLVGQTIDGKYRVHDVLGVGGMGTVLLAEHIAIGRPVAIKVLHKNQLHQEQAVRRFHREARAAGTIGHPNICEVYDVGALADGSPYLVMERLVGETLGDRLASRGPLDTDEIVDVFSQVLSGLVAAHEKGIVHRDVKPANVFITRPIGYPTVVKLLDFGISLLPLGPGDDAVAGVMGTPHYMAPEQAGGEPNLDGQVDVYSCGVMLYEALTGHLPLTAHSFEALLAQVLTRNPRPARDLRPGMPADLDAVLGKALARERDRRYAGAAAFLMDLQALRGPRAPSMPVPPRRSGAPDALPTERDLSTWDEQDDADPAEK